MACGHLGATLTRRAGHVTTCFADPPAADLPAQTTPSARPPRNTVQTLDVISTRASGKPDDPLAIPPGAPAWRIGAEENQPRDRTSDVQMGTPGNARSNRCTSFGMLVGSTNENPPPDSAPLTMNRTPMRPRNPAVPSPGASTLAADIAISSVRDRWNRPRVSQPVRDTRPNRTCQSRAPRVHPVSAPRFPSRNR